MTLLSCGFITHKFSLMLHNGIDLISPINYHLIIVATPLISISSADFKIKKIKIKKLSSEVTFSLYYRDVTETKFCYRLYFFFMPEAHGKSRY